MNANGPCLNNYRGPTAGAKIAFTQPDVGTEAACLAFVDGAGEKFGRRDILVNNAGIRKIAWKGSFDSQRRVGRRGIPCFCVNDPGIFQT